MRILFSGHHVSSSFGAIRLRDSYHGKESNPGDSIRTPPPEAGPVQT